MKCFVTGADESYADILDWFIHHYNQHISLPLYIADFGLKRTYPNSFKVKWKDNAWYYKPRAIKECPADQVCWIDVDCEILADISDVFDLTKKDIGVTEDFCRTRSWNPHGLLPMATGLCCFNSKNQLLDDWIKERMQRKQFPPINELLSQKMAARLLQMGEEVEDDGSASIIELEQYKRQTLDEIWEAIPTARRDTTRELILAANTHEQVASVADPYRN